MFRISKLADYGTVIMVFLAQKSDELYNAKDIATEIGLPIPTVSKLLKLLTTSGCLQSQRGAKGGYHLAREADQVSVADIIQAVEGNTGLTECSVTDGECHIEDVCRVRANWRLINGVVQQALQGVTLADLAAPSMSASVVDINTIRHFTAINQEGEYRGG